ncbi:MAG: LysM peptidoglycan-binding domain-containing protein [Planctomycetota bacterium]|nr:MAG: LysM peptidoglycan-binding domain-containing protein [Planctomycetota bacterium]
MLGQAVRFLAGLTMVVVGVALAAPFAVRLVEAHGDGAPPPAGAAAEGATAAAAWAGTAPAAYAIPDSRGVSQSQPADLEEIQPHVVIPGSLPADRGVLPPRSSGPPPAPLALPQPPGDLSLAPPAFDATYRSTLDVPPPPLLDSAGPAALAVTRAGFDAVAAQGTGEVRVASADLPAALPAVYIIRDGDDLTSIASKLYGHPGAAEAIWSANRDRLEDANVLPIGLPLRIPSTWVPPAVRASQSGGPAVIEPARRPAHVKVGPGETLESLAQRFYGDRSWAGRLWEANRDRLRNPSLLVAGMELRLP